MSGVIGNLPYIRKPAHATAVWRSHAKRLLHLRRNRQLWWIQSVYVHPNHRRQGYFKALYQYIRKAAADAQAGGLRLYADTSNTQAHATVSCGQGCLLIRRSLVNCPGYCAVCMHLLGVVHFTLSRSRAPTRIHRSSFCTLVHKLCLCCSMKQWA